MQSVIPQPNILKSEKYWMEAKLKLTKFTRTLISYSTQYIVVPSNDNMYPYPLLVLKINKHN